MDGDDAYGVGNGDNGVRVGGSDDRVSGAVVIVGVTDDLGNGEKMVRCC